MNEERQLDRIAQKLRKLGLDAQFDNMPILTRNVPGNQTQGRRPVLLVRDYSHGIELTLSGEGIKYLAAVGMILASMGEPIQKGEE